MSTASLLAAVPGSAIDRHDPATAARSALVGVSLRVQQGTAIFRASARVGDFAGTTAAVTGEVEGTAPDDARGWVEVALDSLRTGNGRRDRHMREALETSRHPRARFALDSLRAAPGTDSVRLHGRFTVRGVTHAASATGMLSAGAGGRWRLSATFPVSLAAHGITKGISRLGGLLSVSDTIRVEVSMLLAPVEVGRS